MKAMMGVLKNSEDYRDVVAYINTLSQCASFDLNLMTSPRLQLDLGALAQNFHFLRRRGTGSLPAEQAAAVVKADAYGLGLEPVARRLWRRLPPFFCSGGAGGRRASRLAARCTDLRACRCDRGHSKRANNPSSYAGAQHPAAVCPVVTTT